jgi:broad specificity phosphatase PhoE
MGNSKVDKEILYHLTLLRHGESTGNVQGLLQGQADYELSPFGRQQTQRLAKRWTAEAAYFERIISSPLTRALQTAEIIATALNVSIEIDPDWMERDFGKLSGRILSEEDLKSLRRSFKIPSEPLGETGESQWDAYHRVERAVINILQRPPGRYLVVAHGGIINQALHYILGLSPRPGSDGPRFILSNSAFASLSYAPNGQIWRLFGLNDNQHLEGLSAELTAASVVDQGHTYLFSSNRCTGPDSGPSTRNNPGSSDKHNA